MKLIVNGDDFGLTKGVTEGLVEAIKNGIMTDTTAMTNMPYFEEAINLAFHNNINEMGIHLTLTCGKPLLPKEEVPSLVDEKGDFFKYKDISKRPETLNSNELEKEFTAQVEKFLSTGMKMNHIDGHHHFYSFGENIFRVVAKIAKKYNVPMRCPFNRYMEVAKNLDVNYPEYLIYDFFEGNVTVEFLKERLNYALENNFTSVELMAHPAYIDTELKSLSSYTTPREAELKLLKSEEILKFIKEKNIELVSFSKL